MTFDYNILEEKMKQLSPEMQTALTSVEISQSIQEIGKKHDLKIDQEGVLFDHAAYVMLGLLPSKDFVKEFAHDADIDQKKAELIGIDLNKEVFDKIRQSMQQIEAASEVVVDTNSAIRENSISSLETAGNFSIEKEKGESDEKTESLKSMSDQNIAQYRETTLSHIEDPKPTTLAPSSWTKDNEKHTEPLVDHLLSKPTSIPTEKIVQKAPEVPKKPIEPPKPVRSGPDPYREVIE